MISLAEFGLGIEVAKREHVCLAIRMYAIFREDHDALLPEGYQDLFLEDGLDGESIDNLCDEQECAIVDENRIMVRYLDYNCTSFLIRIFRMKMRSVAYTRL